MKRELEGIEKQIIIRLETTDDQRVGPFGRGKETSLIEKSRSSRREKK